VPERPTVRVLLTWTAANLALGCLAAIPLLTIVVFSYYVRAKLWGTVASPIRDGEAAVPVLLIVGVGAPVTVAAVLVNRALRRRLGARRWAALVFWAATAAVLLAPFLAFVIFPDLSTVIF
jgi:hypothetical protein